MAEEDSEVPSLAASGVTRLRPLTNGFRARSIACPKEHQTG
jgi:hypothetical protein